MSLTSSQPLDGASSGAGRPRDEVGSRSGAEREGSPSVAGLLTGDARVAPDERVERVAQLFFGRPDLEAVALVEGERPVGLLTSSRAAGFS